MDLNDLEEAYALSSRRDDTNKAISHLKAIEGGIVTIDLCLKDDTTKSLGEVSKEDLLDLFRRQFDVQTKLLRQIGIEIGEDC